MTPQRKVTAFLTRGSGAGMQLCVFRHAGAGVQIPAGTVEDGESYETAARREAAEETGLEDFELAGSFGTRRFPATPGYGWITRPISLLTRPAADAPRTSWSLGRTGVQIRAGHGDYARVVYQEVDADATDEPTVYARLEGWVPADCVTDVQERAFFHFHASAPTPDRWHVQAEPGHRFDLYWIALTPKPTVLIGAQQEWLDEFHADLTA